MELGDNYERYKTTYNISKRLEDLTGVPNDVWFHHFVRDSSERKNRHYVILRKIAERMENE
jgi:hypothetical protein